jgi:putative sterol carrier protein
MSAMSDETTRTPTAAQFLETQVVPRFVAAVADVERRLAQAQKELEDLRDAAGTICWSVEGGAPAYFNFAGGKATIEAKAAAEPVMTVRLAVLDWERLVSGKVAGGFLDGGNRGGFGKSRLDRLKPLRGTLRFTLTEVEAGGDWTVDLGLNGTPSEPPTATITMPAAVASEIQAGKVNPQMAFMQGKVKMLGDAGLVMQFGMAMFV